MKSLTEGSKNFLILAIKAYQKTLSGKVASCRFLPTCSEYAIEAIERFGVLKGGLLAIERISRCHPAGEGGFDPVVKT